MKLIKPPTYAPLYDSITISLTFDKSDATILLPMWQEMVNRWEKVEYTITEARKSRSKDANAYAWVLISKLAKKLGIAPTEVYREVIKDSAAYTVVPIREDLIEAWTRRWEMNGTGWMVDDIGPCRNTPGYHNLRCFHGSSAYDPKEMSYLIDALIGECQEQGIETMTPAEIERLKAEWKEAFM